MSTNKTPQRGFRSEPTTAEMELRKNFAAFKNKLKKRLSSGDELLRIKSELDWLIANPNTKLLPKGLDHTQAVQAYNIVIQKYEQDLH